MMKFLCSFAVCVGCILSLVGCNAAENNQLPNNAVLPKGEFSKSDCYNTRLATIDETYWKHSCGVDLFNLGLSYELGINGRDKNFERAVILYEQASKLGHTDAMVNLAMLYEHGYGIEKNLSKAFEYNEKAASLNNPKGANNLAIMYLKGEGTKKNNKKAVELFEKAAKLGSAESAFGLSKCYAKGWGVAINDITAYAWLKIAADTKGDRQEEYKQVLQLANTQISVEGIQKANTLAEEIKKKIYPSDQ